MQLTNAEVQILRSRPHQANVFMSIYKPKTIFACQVMSGTYSTGDVNIPYMSISTGTVNILYPDITFLIGTSFGNDDYGRLRMRYASGTSSNSLTFAENAINWTEGMYLTAIDQIDVVSKYPRIITDPSNSTNVIFYKDLDIPYSNQNSIYGTFPCAGPHRAAFLPSGTLYFTATGTTNILSESLTYQWTFEGGTPTGSTALTPGNVRWTQPGHYKTSLRVTSASGAVDTTYRYVSIYERPNEGTNVPILQWEITREISGSRSEGGYETSFRVYQNLDDVQPNAIVVLFMDNYYGEQRINLGGNAPGNSSILFVGYIIGDSIKFDYQSSSVEFSVASITQVMKEAEGFSVSCESVVSPSTWFQLKDMTVSKALYHYLKWHSTVLQLADFQYTGDNHYVQYFDSDRGSMYDAIDNFLRTGMLGEVVCDRQGKIWAEISSYGRVNPLSEIPTINPPLQPQDWVGEVSVAERRNSEMSFVELGGIAYYGAVINTFSALISNAPSTVPLYHGKPERREGMILSSQSELNQISGNFLAHHNAQFPDVSMGLAGIYTNLDIAPLQKYHLVISPSRSVRNKSLQQYPYYVDSMEWRYSPVNQSLHPTVSFTQMATGTAGVTVDIPVTPPESGYAYPSLQMPPLPIFPPSLGHVGQTVLSQVVFHDPVGGIIYTNNFDVLQQNILYQTMNAGLSETQRANVNWLKVCPNGSVWVAYIAPGGDGNFLAYAPYVGGSFTVLVNYESPDEVNHLWGVGIDTSSPERIAFVKGPQTAKKFYVGNSSGFTEGASINHFVFPFNQHYAISYGLGKWMLTYYNSFALVSSDGSTVLSMGSSPSYDIKVEHLRAGFSGVTFHNAELSNIWTKGENNLATLTSMASVIDISIPTMDCDPTGQYMMSSLNGKSKTSDYGATWATMGSLPVGNWCFGYAGFVDSATAGLAFIAAGAVVRYTPDFGLTWISKENQSLLDITPFPAIDRVQMVG